MPIRGLILVLAEAFLLFYSFEQRSKLRLFDCEYFCWFTYV